MMSTLLMDYIFFSKGGPFLIPETNNWRNMGASRCVSSGSVCIKELLTSLEHTAIVLVCVFACVICKNC